MLKRRDNVNPVHCTTSLGINVVSKHLIKIKNLLKNVNPVKI